MARLRSDQQTVSGQSDAEPTPPPAASAGADSDTGSAAATQNNRMATAGAVTSIVPPLGLALSITGLVRSKAIGGAGKAAAITGIVLSLAFAGGYGLAFSAAASSGGSDPVCASAPSALQSMQRTFGNDAQNGSNWNIAPEAVATEITTDAGDVGNARTEVDNLISKSTHADVTAKLQDLDDMLAQTANDYSSSDANPFTDMQKLSSRLTTDRTAIDSLCGTATAG
jgi:hypothetical protein